MHAVAATNDVQVAVFASHAVQAVIEGAVPVAKKPSLQAEQPAFAAAQSLQFVTVHASHIEVAAVVAPVNPNPSAHVVVVLVVASEFLHSKILVLVVVWQLSVQGVVAPVMRFFPFIHKLQSDAVVHVLQLATQALHAPVSKKNPGLQLLAAEEHLE